MRTPPEAFREQQSRDKRDQRYTKIECGAANKKADHRTQKNVAGVVVEDVKRRDNGIQRN